MREDDKSGTFVVCDKSDYKDAALNDLNKQTNIFEVTGQVEPSDIIQQVEEEIENVIDVMLARKNISAQTAEFIKHKVEEHRVARF